MCRNIRTLFNFEPPATEEEIRASAVQFVRKLSGFTAPSKANEAAFNRAVEEVAHAARADRLARDNRRPARPRHGTRQSHRTFEGTIRMMSGTHNSAPVHAR